MKLLIASLLMMSSAFAKTVCTGKINYSDSYAQVEISFKDSNPREILGVNLEMKLMPGNDVMLKIEEKDVTSDEYNPRSEHYQGMQRFSLSRGWTEYDLILPVDLSANFVGYLQQNGHDSGPTITLKCTVATPPGLEPGSET